MDLAPPLPELLNSGRCCLDAAGGMKEKGKSVFKNWWDVTQKDIDPKQQKTLVERTSKNFGPLYATNRNGFFRAHS